MFYKDVQSSLRATLLHLEQTSIDVMHPVKKLEKFEKEIDLFHVSHLQHISIYVFFHHRGIEME